MELNKESLVGYLGKQSGRQEVGEGVEEGWSEVLNGGTK